MLCSNMFSVVASAILLSTVIDVHGRAYKYPPQIHGSVSHKKIIATWEEAKQRCENEGAVLASPIDNDLLEYMKSSIGVNNHTTPYFIGMKAVGNPELIFVSVEGILLDNLPEGAMDMIDELDPSVGNCLSMDRYNIRVVACRARLPYLCYIPNPTSEAETQSRLEVTTQNIAQATTEVTTAGTTVPTTEVTPEATTVTPSECGSGYKLYATGSCYKVHTQRVKWDDAQATCVSEGGYLAIINNEYEAQVIENFAFLETDSNWITIGLRDYKEDGHWTSVHNNSIDQLYNVWAESRSNDRYCGSLKKIGGKVDDQYCWALYPFVCERDHGENTEDTTPTSTEATTEVTTQIITEVTTEVTPLDCGFGYKLYPTGSCYKVHSQKVQWDDAQSMCVSEGGYLAVINNEYEAQVIGNFAFLETDANWITIGLRDYREDGHWTSVHDDPIDQIYNIWAESRSNDRYCGSLKKVGSKVDDQYCKTSYPFVCERVHREATEVTTQETTEVTTEVPTQTTTAAPSDCGSGYKLYATDSCYKVHLQRMYWDEAQSTCVSEGGYLAIINNEYEAQVIGNFAFLETDANWITIGLRDYNEDGHWTSVHKDPIKQLYNVWADSRSNDRYCGSLKKVGGKLDDQYCRAPYPFVCERLVSP